MNPSFFSKILTFLIVGIAILETPAAKADPQPYWLTLVQQAQHTHQASAPSERVNWSGFSPDGIAMPLVRYGIYSARQSIHVLAYIITNRGDINALAEQARKGVDVIVVVDYEESVAKDHGNYIRRGLDYLIANGVHVCSTSAFPLMHDKSMVIDGKHVQDGSINYTEAGEHSNSEDATLAWNDQDNAMYFEQHFQSRLATCQPLPN